MSTPTVNPPLRRGNPLLKILLSAVALGVAIYVTEDRRTSKSTKSGLPGAPAFRSAAPSSEGANSFAWIPRYPGATISNIRSQETSSVLTYGFGFQAAAAPADIAEYFDGGLRAHGFSVTTRTPSANETNLHGESSNGKRQIDVGIDKVPAGSVVIVSATEQ